MNAQRRKELARIRDLIADAKRSLESVRDEEQEAFDNMPEGLRYSERGETMQSNIDTMSEIIDELDEGENKLDKLRAR